MVGRGWEWKKAAKNVLSKARLCTRRRRQLQQQVVDNNIVNARKLHAAGNSPPPEAQRRRSISPNNKNLCAICLDPLSSGGQAIFTAQCSHSFHFTCISSNVRHGSVTCPICRDRWTELPRRRDEPIAQNDDDDDDMPDRVADQPLVRISPLIASIFNRGSGFGFNGGSRSSTEESSSLEAAHFTLTCFRGPRNSRARLTVKLDRQPATDLVLVASPGGAQSHSRTQLMKRAMILVVFSMRAVDRLAIVTDSTPERCIFPLGRMASERKRAALHVLDRLLDTGRANPIDGLRKGVKILEDRLYKNPRSCILHLTDIRSGTYPGLDLHQAPFAIHRFDVGLGYGTSNRFIMHQFEEFLATRVRGAIRDIQVRVGEGTRIVRIGRMRAGEERSVPVYVDGSGPVSVEYSYIDGGDGECVRRGEVVVGMEEDGD